MELVEQLGQTPEDGRTLEVSFSKLIMLVYGSRFNSSRISVSSIRLIYTMAAVVDWWKHGLVHLRILNSKGDDMLIDELQNYDPEGEDLMEWAANVEIEPLLGEQQIRETTLHQKLYIKLLGNRRRFGARCVLLHEFMQKLELRNAKALREHIRGVLDGAIDMGMLERRQRLFGDRYELQDGLGRHFVLYCQQRLNTLYQQCRSEHGGFEQFDTPERAELLHLAALLMAVSGPRWACRAANVRPATLSRFMDHKQLLGQQLATVLRNPSVLLQPDGISSAAAARHCVLAQTLSAAIRVVKAAQ